jgi:hypothetical protein
MNRGGGQHLAQLRLDREARAVAHARHAVLDDVVRDLEAEALPEREDGVHRAAAAAVDARVRRGARAPDELAADPRAAVAHAPRGVLLVLQARTRREVMAQSAFVGALHAAVVRWALVCQLC